MGSNRQPSMWCRQEHRQFRTPTDTMKLDRGQQCSRVGNVNYFGQDFLGNCNWRRAAANELPCTTFLPGFVGLSCKMSANAAPWPANGSCRGGFGSSSSSSNGPNCHQTTAGNKRNPCWSRTTNRTSDRPRRSQPRSVSPPLVQRYRPIGFAATSSKPPSTASDIGGRALTATPVMDAASRLPDCEVNGETGWRTNATAVAPTTMSSNTAENSWRSSTKLPAQSSPRLLDDRCVPQWPGVAQISRASSSVDSTQQNVDETGTTTTTYASILKRSNPCTEDPATTTTTTTVAPSHPVTTAPIAQNSDTQLPPQDQSAAAKSCVIISKFIKLVPTSASGLVNLYRGVVSNDAAKSGSIDASDSCGSPKQSCTKTKSGQNRLDDLKKLLTTTTTTTGDGESGGAANSLDEVTATTRTRLSSFSSSPPSGTLTCGSPQSTEATLRFACLLGLPRRRHDFSGSTQSSSGGDGPTVVQQQQQQRPPPQSPAISSGACSNSLIAFIMGVGLSPDALGASDADSDWESDWDDEDCVDGATGCDSNVSSDPFLDDQKATVALSSDSVCDPNCSEQTKDVGQDDATIKCPYVSTTPSTEQPIDDCDAYEQQLRFHLQLTEDALREVNARWQLEYDETPLADKTTQKVSFADETQLCDVHEADVWCRKGEWEELARDRHRFQRRIVDAATVLGPILQTKHRQRVYERIARD